MPVTYRAVIDPPLSGPLTFRMKEGTSQYWFAVLVGGHGNPLSSVEAKAGGSAWRAATRQVYNYWVIDAGLGSGPYTIRVTDVYGHQAVAAGIRLAPGQTQQTTVRMYGSGAPGPARTTASSGPPAQPPTTVEPGASTVGSSTAPGPGADPSRSDSATGYTNAGSSSAACVHSGR